MKKIFCAGAFIFLIFYAEKIFAKEEYKTNDFVVDSLFDNSTKIFSEDLLPVKEYLIIKGDKNYVTAGIMGVFCGWTGLHRFYLGHTKAGFTYLAAGVCLPVLYIGVLFVIFGYGVATLDPMNQEESSIDNAAQIWSYAGCIVAPAMQLTVLLGIIDGVIYLVAGEKKFQSKYRNNKKLIQWI